MLYRISVDNLETDMCFPAMASDDPEKIALDNWPELQDKIWEAKQVKRQFSE